MTGVPGSPRQSLVVVPAHPPGPHDPGDAIRFELRQLTGGTPVLPVFSTVAGLVRELGPCQPWVRSTSPLASFAADWTGADIRRLHDLAATLYGYLPGITGVTTALNHEVAQLTGGDQGWRGPAASAFAAAWQRDAAAVEALAQVMAWTADITDDLAAELATIERTLEEAAQDGTPTYRLAYDQAMADARQASERAAVRLSDLYAVFTAGREPVVRQVVGGPAGSIEGVTAADMVQVGLGDEATAPADADAGHLWDGVL